MAEYYRYLKYLKYINGIPAVPAEYKLGDLIGTGEYDNIEDCEQDAIYRWVDNGKTVCKDYSLYNQEKRQRSTDGGISWTDTGEVRDGSKLIELYAKKCGWKLMTKWEKTGKTVCNGSSLSEEYIKLESYDMGKTWQNSVPEEYKYEVVEAWSKDCILATEPIIIEVYGKNEYTLPLTLTNTYWTQWEEEGIIYDSSIDTENAHTHTYSDTGNHIIKVWGWATSLLDLDYNYSILSWGTNYNDGSIGTGGSIFIKAHSFLNPDVQGYNLNFDSGVKTQFATINVGEYLDSWVTDTLNVLRDNREFVVHNTKITHLPVNTFNNMNTYLLDVSNCTNLLDIPTLLEEGTERFFKGWYKLRALNCTSLTAVPEGIFERYFSKDEYDSDNLNMAFILFNCIGAFEGCTSLTTLPSKIDAFFTRDMFKGCTSLTDISNCTIITSYSPYMFEGCTNLTTMPYNIGNAFKIYTTGRVIWIWDITDEEEPLLVNPYNGAYNYYSVNREGMFGSTQINAVDLNKLDYTTEYIPENIDPNSERVFSSNNAYKEMFMNSPIKLLTGAFSIYNNSYRVSNCTRMFYNADITLIPSLFAELTSIPLCVLMFAKCNISSLPNDIFNYEVGGTNILNRLLLMFESNELTNYPILKDLPIWKWPNLYDGTLLLTYTFIGNDNIALEVPFEWGGYMYNGTLVPVTIEVYKNEWTLRTDGKAIYDWGDGLFSTSDTHTYNDGLESHTIKFWGTFSKWTLNGGTDYNDRFKIIDFGDNVLPTKPNTAFTTPIYLGGNQGAFKATTSLNIFGSMTLLNEVSMDFLKNMPNLNSVDGLFNSSQITSMPEGFFQLLPTITSAAGCFRKSIITNADGLFKDMPNLIRVDDVFKECRLLVSAKEAFKGCTSLSSASDIFGDSASLYSNKILTADSMFEGCTSLSNISFMGAFPDYSTKLLSATACFKGCINLTFGGMNALMFILLDGCDLTDFCNGCTSISLPPRFTGNGHAPLNVNFTRCFSGCTNMTKSPLIDGKKLWEIEGAVGTECFKDCTLMSDYNEVPDNWK